MMTWRWRLEVKREWVLRSIIGCLRTSPSRLLSPHVHAILLSRKHVFCETNSAPPREIGRRLAQIIRRWAQMEMEGEVRSGRYRRRRVTAAASFGCGPAPRPRSGRTNLRGSRGRRQRLRLDAMD